MALVHHDQTVAQTDGVVHVVRDHERGQVVLVDDFLGQVEHLRGRLGVEGRSVLVEQQQARPGERGHQQGECLALATREQADLGVETRVQTKVQALEQLNVLIFLGLGDAPRKAATLAATLGEGQVLGNLHVGSGTAHGVLKHAAQVLGALRLAQARDVGAVELDNARIERVHAGDHVEQRGLAGAVAADHGYKVAVIQGEVDAGERALLGDGALVKGLLDMRELKHLPHLPSCRSCGAYSAPKPRARTGPQRQSRRRAASCRWRPCPTAARWRG